MNGRARPGYRHMQTGYLLIWIVAATSSATLIVRWATLPNLAATLALYLQLAVMVAFCSSVIEVKHGSLSVRYGPGWIGRKIALHDIRLCQIVRTPWAYGWGIPNWSG